MKAIVSLAVRLLVITVAVAAALAGVNAVTAERISAAEAEKMQQAIVSVLPGCTDIEQVEGAEFDLVTAIYSTSLGYAVQVEPQGFGGAITMVVGVGTDGCVTGVEIVSHSETAGLGAKAAASTGEGPGFRASFIGLSGEVTVSKDGGQADTLTSATITSRAVAEGVSAALAAAAAIEEGAQ